MNIASLFCCLSLGFLSLPATGAVSPETFAQPPAAHHPETWFHFIGGNVSEKGIHADLEAIQSAGISGIQFFHGQFGGAWPGVEPQIKCLSAPWDGLVGRLAGECQRRGLRFTMQNCPGWAMAGGPWIAPSNAMRHLAVSRTDCIGGKRVELSLPQPGGKEPWRDYREVAVLAFPTPAGDTGAALTPIAIQSNRTALDWNAWLKGHPVALPAAAPAATQIELTFAKPVTLRTVEFPSVNSMGHVWNYEPQTDIRMEALTATGAVTVAQSPIPQGNWQDDQPLTFACSESTAKAYRVTIANRHAIELGTIRFWSAARQENWEAAAGWTLRSLLHHPAPAQSPAAFLTRAAITNLSAALTREGRLVWDAPVGAWTVLRIGHVNTGRQNGPAPAEATGWECDKLAPAGADAQFAGYIGRLAGPGGPVQGKLAAMLMDSWECKTQTWTPGLDATFQKTYGYALTPWMPALFGWVVESPELTARFHDDWRAFLSRLIAKNFYGRMARHAHENGLEIQFETAFGDVLPGDILEYYQYADTPMCEFWQPRQENFVGSFNFKAVKPCVSAARLYGKKRVAAEAFTSMQLSWNEKLRDLKYVANLHLAEGITHLIFHTYTHNPRTDALPPGTSFGANIGTPFLRGQTWWRAMPEFTAYLARCELLLEEGRPVSAVLWYLGDESDHKPSETAPFPAGYRYDYCNPDALLRRLRVEAGLWQTPEGIAYRVMWIPECTRLRPETLEKLLSLVRQGGTLVVAKGPVSLATLADGERAERRFQAACRALAFATCGQTRVGQGRVICGKPLDEALRMLSIEPDVLAEGLVWQHRRLGTRDVYFLAAQKPEGYHGPVEIHDHRVPTVWNPVNGTLQRLAAVERFPQTVRFTLDLPPSGACFLVFDAAGPAGAMPADAKPITEKSLGPWQLAFPAGWGISQSLTLTNLVAWKDLPLSAEGKAFSGTATYSTDFTLDALDRRMRYEVNLGRVETIAAVILNGERLRTLWCEPYRLDVTEALRPGANTLQLEVTDTWFNRLVYDAGRPESARKTWTIHGPSKEAALNSSGCLGPVTLIAARPGNEGRLP